MIKAIETTYKGYRFRSRLEARWAVFFDALGVRWEYEPEGFELPSGRYLPDFRLPDELVQWVEVKGAEPTPRELQLAEELARGRSAAVFVSAGMPDALGSLACEARGWSPVSAQLAHCLGPVIFRRFEAAVAAARSARFEHGESGAPSDDPFGDLRR